MAQNINLYSRGRKKSTELFSARGVVLIALALTLGFGLLALTEIQRTGTLRTQIASAKTESERLTRLLKEIPTDASQSERLAAEERDIKALEIVAARLTAGVLGRAGSFTESLKGLGRATREGVWLTGIKLHQASGRLVLEGKALDAARVPLLIEALSQQPQFAGTAFAALDIKRDEAHADSGVVLFRITSQDAQPLAVLDTPKAKAAPRATAHAKSALNTMKSKPDGGAQPNGGVQPNGSSKP